MNAVPNTPYPELPWVLDALVAGVRAVIADDLVGVYLVGSLATGDFDLDSDVDFLVVSRQELADAVIPRLQAMHTRIHGLALAHTHQCVGQAFVNCARFSAGQDAGPVRFFSEGTARAGGGCSRPAAAAKPVTIKAMVNCRNRYARRINGEVDGTG